MEVDAHGFSDSDTEYDELRSNSLTDEDAPDVECAWAHPYEAMELILPAAKLELRDFPVVDLAHEAEAACKREGKVNLLAPCHTGDAGGAAGVTRKLGKGSWTIRVGQSGGVGRLVHEENPGADSKAIVPCVDRDGQGQVLVGNLGGDGWEFAEVARSDKRSQSLLWARDKCSGASKGQAKGGAARLPTDIADMTPEERLARERRDEKNRKERERRAQLKLEKLAKREEELAQAAAAAAAQAESAPPGGPNALSAPTTPAPSTPPESSEAGTPHAVKAVRQDFMNVPAKPVTATTCPSAGTPSPPTSHAGTLSTPSSTTPVRQQQPLVQPVSGTLPTHAAPLALAPAAAVPARSPAAIAPTLRASGPAGPQLGAAPRVPTTSNPAALPATQLPVVAAVEAAATAALPASSQAPAIAPQAASPPSADRPFAGKKPPAATTSAAPPAPPAPPTVAASVPAKVVALPAPAYQAPASQPTAPPTALSSCATSSASAVLPGATPTAAPAEAASAAPAPLPKELPHANLGHKDGDDTMKENVEDEEMTLAQNEERGRCQAVEDLSAKQALSKRRRIASLSPVEVNCRASDTKRAVRPRGVQRA